MHQFRAIVGMKINSVLAVSDSN